MLRKIDVAPFVAVFWLTSLVEIIVLWKTVPTTLSQAALIIMLALSGLLIFLRKLDFPLLAAIFTTIVTASYWQVGQNNTMLVSLLAIFIIIPVLGLLKELIEHGPSTLTIDTIGQWLLLGLLTAEMVSFFASWQISFFNRSLLIAIIFYLFWRLIELFAVNTSRQKLINHFIFVAVAAIVVIGIIIWSNSLKITAF